MEVLTATFIHWWCKCKVKHSIWRIVWQGFFFTKLSIYSLCDLVILLPKIYPVETKNASPF